MKNKILNITNGDVFNRYLISQNSLEAVPFREAMMDGKAIKDIFSEEFIELRSKHHNVSVDEYRANIAPIIALDKSDPCELVLWFGQDTFCQINLLTLLAYLEQIGYGGKVTLNYIDDETFEIVEENIPVELGIYKTLYKDILIERKMPDSTGVLDTNAIELFFDYHSPNGVLAKSVKENKDMEKLELIKLLLDISAKYGLSDIQAEWIIERYGDDLNK